MERWKTATDSTSGRIQCGGNLDSASALALAAKGVQVLVENVEERLGSLSWSRGNEDWVSGNGSRPRSSSESGLADSVCSADYLARKAQGLASIGNWGPVVALGRSHGAGLPSRQRAPMGRPRSNSSSSHASIASVNSNRSIHTQMRTVMSHEHSQRSGRLASKLVDNVTINIVVVGATNSGKSSLIKSFVRADKQSSSPKTKTESTRDKGIAEKTTPADSFIVADFFRSKVHHSSVRVGDCEVHVQLWDTAGLEHMSFEAATPLLSSANAVVFCFDVTNRNSLHELLEWYKIARHSVRRNDVAMFLFANKVDRTRHRQVPLEEALLIAHRLNLKLFESSSAGSLRELLTGTFESIVMETVEMQLNSLQLVALLKEFLPFEPIKAVQLVLQENKAQKKGFWNTCKRLLSSIGKFIFKQSHTQKTRVLSTQLIGPVYMGQWLDLGAMEVVRFVYEMQRRREVASITPRQGDTMCPAGCGEIVEDKALAIQEHLNTTCPKRRVSCPLGCGEKVAFDSKQQHVKNNCLKRVLLCTTCSGLHEASDFVQHEQRWMHLALGLWTNEDFCHFLHHDFGPESAHSFKDFEMEIDGTDLLDKESREAIGSRLGLDLTMSLASYLTPYQKLQDGQTRISSANNKNRQVLETETEISSPLNEDASTETEQIADKESSRTSPDNTAKTSEPFLRNIISLDHGQNSSSLPNKSSSGKSRETSDQKHHGNIKVNLMSSITSFDREKLNHKSDNSAEDAISSHQPSRPNFLAGIANFDRKKLRPNSENKSFNGDSRGNSGRVGLVNGIANFDRSKLRHFEKDEKRTPVAKSSGNPLMDALSKALDQRRGALEGESDEEFV